MAKAKTIMAEWKEYILTDLAEILDFKRVPLSTMERSKRKGVYPYYGASGIIDHIDDYLFEGEFVLISEDGENLKSRKTSIAFKADGKFWVNNHAHVIKGKCDYLNNLLVYFFSNLDLSPFITGAVQPKLSQENLFSIPILLPQTESEQRAIASTLSSLDSKIDLLHRQNKTLEALAETLFRERFLEDDDIEKDELPLKQLVKVIDNRGKTPTFSKGITDYPIIEVKSLSGNSRFVNFNASEKYVDEETYKTWFRSGHPQINDILFSTVGSIGETAFVIEEKGAIAQNVVALRATNISAIYLFQFLSLKKIKNIIKDLDIGAVQPSIKVPHLLELEVVVPKKKTMIAEYEIKVIPMIKKMNGNQIQIRTLTQLRDTLLPKLMSGEVRVSEL